MIDRAASFLHRLLSWFGALPRVGVSDPLPTPIPVADRSRSQAARSIARR